MNNIEKLTDNLYIVALKQNLPGFDRFVNSLVYKGEKTFLIDVGTLASMPILLKSLEQLEVNSIDAILLTHIHIDHAGGTGELVKHFPHSPVVVHRSGLKHLISPEKLWQGSLKTLGAMAEAYGEIVPVPENNLIDVAEFSEFGITPIMTPGHAPHHVSYLHEDMLYAGEVAGVFFDKGGEDFYLRPATPPRFFMETFLGSIDRVAETEHRRACFGHFGMSKNPKEVYGRAKEQIELWAEIIHSVMDRQDSPNFIENTTELLLAKDYMLKDIQDFGEGFVIRERGFMKNSILGFLEFFNSGS